MCNKTVLSFLEKAPKSMYWSNIPYLLHWDKWVYKDVFKISLGEELNCSARNSRYFLRTTIAQCCYEGKLILYGFLDSTGNVFKYVNTYCERFKWKKGLKKFYKTLKSPTSKVNILLVACLYIQMLSC